MFPFVTNTAIFSLFVRKLEVYERVDVLRGVEKVQILKFGVVISSERTARRHRAVGMC